MCCYFVCVLEPPRTTLTTLGSTVSTKSPDSAKGILHSHSTNDGEGGRRGGGGGGCNHMKTLCVSTFTTVFIITVLQHL